MADITIHDLDLITSPSLLANGDIFHFQDVLDAYTDKVAALSAIAEFILREKSIPSVGSAIVTDTATQTLTNKTLTSPKINSATTITANGADINKLSGTDYEKLRQSCGQRDVAHRGNGSRINGDMAISIC
jgi:hypothetical protein